MCDCLKKTEEETKKHVTESIQQKKGYKIIEASFENTGLVFLENGSETKLKSQVRLYLPFEFTYWKTKKDGSLPKNKSKGSVNILPSYCPFCGEKYDELQTKKEANPA